MAELDLALKVLLDEEPAALARLALGQDVVLQSIESAPTELPARGRLMDKLLRLVRSDDAEPEWLHVEVVAAWRSTTPRTTHEYWALAHAAHDRVTSVVICLKRGKRRGTPKGEYVVRRRKKKILEFCFDVVCLWDLRATDVLRDRVPGLLPLIPFMDGSSPARVDEALHALDHVEPIRKRAELKAVLATLAGNVYPDVAWLARIPEEILMESTFYSSVLEKGWQKGRAEGRVEGRVEGRAEGRAEGRVEGRAEGRAEAMRDVVASGLRQRFGADCPLLPRLEGCDEALLERLCSVLMGSAPPETIREAVERLLPPSA